MKLATNHFGEIEIEEEKIIKFERGLIGFEDHKQFIIFYEDAADKDIVLWMQCVDDGSLAFPVINPFTFYPEYSPDVDDEFVNTIGELNEEDLQVFSVVVIRDDIKDMTVNLKAPILINHKTMKGMQVIANNEELGIRHNLYEQMQFLRNGE